jgi:hypothetical protein
MRSSFWLASWPGAEFPCWQRKKTSQQHQAPLKQFRERTIPKSYMCVLPAVTEETARRWPPRSDSRAQESGTSKSVTASAPSSAVDFGTAGMENYHHEKILVYRLRNSIQFFQYRGRRYLRLGTQFLIAADALDTLPATLFPQKKPHQSRYKVILMIFHRDFPS